MLSRFGRGDVAYDLLNQKTFPSWLYPVRQGATTIWERWDGIRPDGTFQDVAMNSFNHYAYGSIGEWMVRVMAGLDVDAQEPGYRHVIVRPQPGGGFTWASATLETMYGTTSAGWRLHEGGLDVFAVTPPNTHATVIIPADSAEDVTGLGKPVGQVEGVRGVRMEGDHVAIEVGAGSYIFTSQVLRMDDSWLKRRASFSGASRIAELVTDADARQVLARHLGAEAMASEALARLHRLTLAAAAEFAPGLIPEEALAGLVEDLARI